jgi:hypothetical protein
MYKLCLSVLALASSVETTACEITTAANTAMMTTTISTSINVNARRTAPGRHGDNAISKRGIGIQPRRSPESEISLSVWLKPPTKGCRINTLNAGATQRNATNSHSIRFSVATVDRVTAASRIGHLSDFDACNDECAFDV